MRTPGVEQLNWQSQQLASVRPDAFKAFYPQAPVIAGLPEEIIRIGGNQLIRGMGYGSAFSGDATKTSLMDLLLVVRNPWAFYNHVAQMPEIRLGTTRTPGFHAEFNLGKGNFYLGNLYLQGRPPQGVKLWVIPLDELTKHAAGGIPDRADSKGGLYLAGRMHKAMFPTFIEKGTPEEQTEIDLAFNRARIDGVWLAMGLMPRIFEFGDLARKYVNLSYAADKRVEKANKSQSLLVKNYDAYRAMLEPIIDQFENSGVLQRILDQSYYVKRMSLPEEAVAIWLKKCASHASQTNYTQNPFTMGFLNGAMYGIRKVVRARER